MGLGDWIRRIWNRRAQDNGTVPYYDVKIGKVVHIPSSELCPGTVQARVQGIDGIVWVSPDQLQPGPHQHPPFDEELRGLIRKIQATFSEHLSRSLEEWEDGFRRDTHPEKEIALWLHAAGVYEAFIRPEDSPERRRDVYDVIVACLTTSPDTVKYVLRMTQITREEANQVVTRFYGKGA